MRLHPLLNYDARPPFQVQKCLNVELNET